MLAAGSTAAAPTMPSTHFSAPGTPWAPQTAVVQLVRSQVPHGIRTLTVREDMVGWVLRGRKRLVSPGGEMAFERGRVFCIPRASQWDVLNDPPPGGPYEARVMAFAPQTVERFHARFGQYAGVPAMQGGAGTEADPAFAATFDHACAALSDAEASEAMREHRALEVLLLLAERGLVFAPVQQLGWADRVHRLVGQRTHVDWTVDTLAQAFHLSASSLQRRLAEEGTTANRCVREARLLTAMALLQGSDLQVSEIALRCGYQSHSRFTAAFRQRFGYAPTHLRP